MRTDAADAVIFDRIGLSQVRNTAKRTVVLQHLGLGNYDNGPGSGDLYVEDIVGGTVPSLAMNPWARQLKTEVQPESQINVMNRGGRYWILCQKTEGRATVNRTPGGGMSEILGGLMYPASSFSASDTASAAFVSVDGCISSIFSKSSYVSNGFYPVYVSESVGGSVKRLKTNQVDWGPVLYRGGCGSAVSGKGVGSSMETGGSGMRVRGAGSAISAAAGRVSVMDVGGRVTRNRIRPDRCQPGARRIGGPDRPDRDLQGDVLQVTAGTPETGRRAGCVGRSRIGTTADNCRTPPAERSPVTNL